MKTRIIGHRGASGLAPENSLASLRAARRSGVDTVEIDARLTADGQIVLMHKNVFLPQKPLPALKHIKLEQGRTLATLDEGLKALGTFPAIIDIKDHGMASKLADVIKTHPKANISFASFLQDELRAIRDIMPHIPIYVLDHFSPIDIISSANRLHANGIGLNKWLMNPLTYRLAKRHHLEIFVYTVNGRFLAWLFKRLYPATAICTDHPERFLKRRQR